MMAVPTRREPQINRLNRLLVTLSLLLAQSGQQTEGMARVDMAGHHQMADGMATAEMFFMGESLGTAVQPCSR